MSGDKCVYFDCNLTRRSSKNIFHPFPANIELHKQWIINSGKYLNKKKNSYKIINLEYYTIYLYNPGNIDLGIGKG